jgi:hypothetical protein
VITQERPGNQRPLFQDAYRHVQKGRPERLDGGVPLASDDDDTREIKIGLLVFAADPIKFMEAGLGTIERFWGHFSAECRRCGADHRSEAKDLAKRCSLAALWALSGGTHGEEGTERQLSMFLLMIIKPDALRQPCARQAA